MSDNQPQTMTRPDWAAGVEWEGFEVGLFTGNLLRKTVKHWVSIARHSSTSFSITVSHPRNGGFKTETASTPESALRIANAIAAEFGGWGS